MALGFNGGALLPDTIPPIPCRIERGNYLADILQGSSAKPFWYYIVQRKGSAEIIDLVKFDTYEQALEAATQILVKMDQSPSAN